MFKNIQQKLLLNNPLLWNLKIVPFAIVAIVFHIIFFALGYINGAIDFSSDYLKYSFDFDNKLILFFSILISIITFIIWIVLYSRNNAFKSFYPKSNFSIFKEWLLILAFCILNISFSATYIYAKDVRVKSYFSEKELNRRMEILSLSSIFIDGSFKEGNSVTVVKNGQAVLVERDSFDFKNRRYSLKSLINKNVINLGNFTHEQDSLNDLRVKNWMVENKKDSVKWLLDEFMKISKEHGLETNITADQWFSYVYSYPDYTNYKTIGKTEKEIFYDSAYYQNMAVEEDIAISKNGIDTTRSQKIQIINGQEYVYSKYYVPFNSLENSYGQIARIFNRPQADSDFFMAYIYAALGLSLALFSFKVTSARDWLIAFVSLIIFGIVSGFITAFAGSEMLFLSIYLLLFFALLAYFTIVLSNKKSKGISAITLNQILWLFPAVVPALYYFTLEISKYNVDYYNYNNYSSTTIRQFPKIEWLEAHFEEMMVANVALVFLFMLVLSVQIKKWKGIAEA